jgi:hypothetical protein
MSIDLLIKKESEVGLYMCDWLYAVFLIERSLDGDWLLISRK